MASHKLVINMHEYKYIMYHSFDCHTNDMSR